MEGLLHGSSMIRLLCLILSSAIAVSGLSLVRPPSKNDKASMMSKISRRECLVIAGGLTTGVLMGPASSALAQEETSNVPEVEVVASGDAKQLFNEGRALESQGNMAAAQRLYSKVTQISPRFIYGWSNLGNTQVALGTLDPAEESYSSAINLCRENIAEVGDKFGVRRCDDLYVLLLNRGCLRLNNGAPKQALEDLQQAEILRGRPDAVVLQNLARAKEINGLYASSDRDYTVAISMTSNEVNPFWLRSALVKYQLGQTKDGFDLLKRVENRFPEAPEVRAAYAAFLAAQGDPIAAQRKFLEIPDRQRKKYVDSNYMQKVVSWPPAMLETLSKVTTAVGDGSAI